MYGAAYAEGAQRSPEAPHLLKTIVTLKHWGVYSVDRYVYIYIYLRRYIYIYKCVRAHVCMNTHTHARVVIVIAARSFSIYLHVNCLFALAFLSL